MISNKRILLNITTLFAALFLLFAHPVVAQPEELTEEQKKQMADQLENIKDQLQLSEEQAAAIKPVLMNSFQERMAIIEKYGINPNDPNAKRPKIRTMRSVGKEMDRVDKNVKDQLSNHLSAEQMETWEQLEAERKEKMRTQMRGKG